VRITQLKKHKAPAMEKIIISTDEIAQTAISADGKPGPAAELPSPIPWWAKACLAPLVLVLPLLCLMTLILRVAVRGLPPRSRYAWIALFSTLLAISGILTSIGFVVAFTVSPAPSILSQGLSEFDSRTQFPSLPALQDLSAMQVSDQLKPLVMVVTPVQSNWFSHVEGPSSVLGAGILLQATPQGYLIATALHVVNGLGTRSGGPHALVASSSGAWARTDVVGRNQNLDLALLWLPRSEGGATFAIPVASDKDVKDGESVFVIGHPQGLRFTLSTGIVSRKDKDSIQITAPVSPGDSGGPLFDARGALAGIVTSMVDRNSSPNAENLNFAVRADALLDQTGWAFSGQGQQYLKNFEQSQHAMQH
jgi:S1-C subfamily serine protease